MFTTYKDSEMILFNQVAMGKCFHLSSIRYFPSYDTLRLDIVEGISAVSIGATV